jgi:hypothetical protein
MTELEDAVTLANRVLEEPYIDPDGDICTLARQFLRSKERHSRLGASHDALLAAAKEALQLGAGHACSIRALRNAIAKADGSCKPYPGDEEQES